MVWASPKMQIAEARGEDSKVQYLASSEARSRRPVVRSAKSAGHSLFGGGGGGGTKEVRTIFFFFDRRCELRLISVRLKRSPSLTVRRIEKN